MSPAEHMALVIDDSNQDPRPTTADQDAELALWRAKSLERMLQNLTEA